MWKSTGSAFRTMKSNIVMNCDKFPAKLRRIGLLSDRQTYFLHKLTLLLADHAREDAVVAVSVVREVAVGSEEPYDSE